MKHFTIEEYIFSQTALRHGIDNSLKTQELKDNAEMTLEFMESIRRVCGNNPVYLSSGYRCPELNSIIGGSPSSQHKKAQAGDILIPNFGSPKKVCEAVADSGLGFDQLIYEVRWTHISTSSDPRGIVLTASFVDGEAVYHDGIV